MPFSKLSRHSQRLLLANMPATAQAPNWTISWEYTTNGGVARIKFSYEPQPNRTLKQNIKAFQTELLALQEAFPPIPR